MEGLNPLIVLRHLSDKKILKEFYQGVFFPDAGPLPVLLVDSWSAHANTVLVEAVKPAGVEIEIFTIPPGTTSIAQHWDVYGFRSYKQMVRYFSDRVLIDNLPVILHQRNEIIKLQSLIYNQLCSPRFKEQWKLGWFKSRYLDQHPDQFTNALQFCFQNKAAELTEKCCKCERLHFITCAWCNETFCFTHYYTEYRYCTEFNE